MVVRKLACSDNSTLFGVRQIVKKIGGLEELSTSFFGHVAKRQR